MSRCLRPFTSDSLRLMGMRRVFYTYTCHAVVINSYYTTVYICENVCHGTWQQHSDVRLARFARQQPPWVHDFECD